MKKMELDKLIVNEGEFNTLQFQSLVVRYGRAIGEDLQYVHCVSVGGVNNADYRNIQRLSKQPIFWCDNDDKDQGEFLVKNSQDHMSCEGVITPGCSDLDEFIRQFDNPAAAWTKVRELIAERKQYYRNYEGLYGEVFWVRAGGGREFQKNHEVAQIIRHDLLDRGAFFNDGILPYLFLKDEKKLIEIRPDESNLKILLARYGINASENIFKYVLAELGVAALGNGTLTQVHRLAYFDRDSFTLYLNNFNNQIYQITADAINLVDNGTDGVLFQTDSIAQPFLVRLQDFEDYRKTLSSSPLHEIVISKINFVKDFLEPDQRRFLFVIWLLSLFFIELFPTKPILVFLGEKGSGKSITNRKVGTLLYGESYNVMPLPSDSKDFDAAVTNSTFVAIDNADSPCKWLNDRLATIATGGTLKRRAYYTTNSLVDYPVECFFAITSRSPNFRRDDNADRSLMMKVKRFKTFKAERLFLEEVIRNRNLLMTEVICHLQEVVRALRDERDNTYCGTFRMADFADFATKIACALGCKDDLEMIFKRLNKEQASFTLEGPIFDLLWLWAGSNSDCKVENKLLCKELSHLAEKVGIGFPYTGNPRGFAQRMSQLRSNFAEFFIITEHPIGQNRKAYSYKRRPRETSP